MKKTLKRICSFLTVVVVIISSVSPALAAENNSIVVVTDDLAVQMAERFAKGISENSEIVANNPRKFYNTAGQAIGYIVNYDYKDKPYGYVVFDTTCESLISEYSLGNNTASPYDVIYQREASTFNEEKTTSKIYKIRQIIFKNSFPLTKII